MEFGFYYLQSRYYDPAIGRFISADSLMVNSPDAYGYNLFAYCGNNPMNNTDPSGKWFIKDYVKWVAKKVAVVGKKVKKLLSNIDATYSAGINVSATPSLTSYNAQIGISVDTKGDVKLQSSFSGGFTAGSPSISSTIYQTVTNAPSIDNLEGPGYQIGGSALVPVYNVPIVASGDFNIIPNDSEYYYGATSGIGLGFGSPGAEVHAEWGNTFPISRTFNIFDIGESIYSYILEW